MKLTRMLSHSAFALLLCAGSHTASAEILAKETFSYPKGTALAGAAGGSGTWAGPWLVGAQTNGATIDGDGLRIGDGSGNPSAKPGSTITAARRTFTKYSGDVVYLKVVLNFDEGTLADPDRFGVFLPVIEHGALLVGTGLEGSGSEVASNKLSARVYDNSKNRISDRGVVGQSETVVVEWSKTLPGSGSPFDKMRVWFNPKADDRGSGSARTLDYGELRTAISQVGFYLAESDEGDVFRVREVTVATTWDDVMSQP